MSDPQNPNRYEPFGYSGNILNRMLSDKTVSDERIENQRKLGEKIREESASMRRSRDVGGVYGATAYKALQGGFRGLTTGVASAMESVLPEGKVTDVILGESSFDRSQRQKASSIAAEKELYNQPGMPTNPIWSRAVVGVGENLLQMFIPGTAAVKGVRGVQAARAAFAGSKALTGVKATAKAESVASTLAVSSSFANSVYTQTFNDAVERGLPEHRARDLAIQKAGIEFFVTNAFTVSGLEALNPL